MSPCPSMPRSLDPSGGTYMHTQTQNQMHITNTHTPPPPPPPPQHDMHTHAFHADAMGQAGFKGLHWAWMAVAAVQYLEDSPDSIHAPLRESKDAAQWLAYYISFLTNFPWDTVALSPMDARAPRGMRSLLQQRKEQMKDDAAILILSGGWIEFMQGGRSQAIFS